MHLLWSFDLLLHTCTRTVYNIMLCSIGMWNMLTSTSSTNLCSDSVGSIEYHLIDPSYANLYASSSPVQRERHWGVWYGDVLLCGLWGAGCGQITWAQGGWGGNTRHRREQGGIRWVSAAFSCLHTIMCTIYIHVLVVRSLCTMCTVQC